MSDNTSTPTYGGLNAGTTGRDNYDGNDVDMAGRIVDSAVPSNATAAFLASAARAKPGVTTDHHTIALAVATDGLRRWVQPGNYVAAFDPLVGLHDTTQLLFGGRYLFPTVQRVEAMTWPVVAGMGVLYRDADPTSGAYWDLTEYLVPSAAAATLEVGAAARDYQATPFGG